MADSFYELTKFDDFVIKELEAREKNIGMSYEQEFDPNRKGPKTAWGRFTSLACPCVADPGSASPIEEQQTGCKQGFIMFGINGFENMYGFGQQPGTHLGFDLNGKTHQTEERTFVHRPTPGVIGIDADLMGGTGKFRVTKVKWTCWSAEQLDYMEPYFLTAGVYCVVEWGWNNFDPESMIDFNDRGKGEKWDSPANDGKNFVTPVEEGTGLYGVLSSDNAILNRIKSSRGNYDVSIGIVTNFDVNLRADGGYDCETTVSTPSQLISGMSGRYQNTISEKDSTASGEKLKKSFRDYIATDINKLVDIVENKEPSPVNPNYTPEDRIFTGRKGKQRGTAPYEYDFSNSSDFWISMGLIVDILNFFFEYTDDRSKTQYNKILIQNSWLSAHPNLKSTDGTVLLIPNKFAPKYSPQLENTGEEAKKGEPNDALKKANDVLNEKIKNDQREDLMSIIETNRQNKRSFPDYDEKKYKSGYAGKLEDLYVHKSLFVDVATKNDTVDMILRELLNSVSAAAGGIWDFDVRQVGNQSNGSGCHLCIVDRNFIGAKSVKELIEAKKHGGDAPYLWKLNTDQSIVRNVSFSIKLPNVVANDTLLSNNPETESNTNTPRKQFEFDPRNCFFQRKVHAQEQLPKDMNSDNPTSNTRKNIIDSKYYIVKEKTNEKSTQKVWRLVEPDAELMKSALIDQESSNTAVYNGIMPGVTLTFDIDGIAGLRFLDCFVVNETLPKRYRDMLYQIQSIKHVIQGGDWITTLEAGVRPLAPVSDSPNGV